MRRLLWIGSLLAVMAGSGLAIAQGVRWFDPKTERWHEVEEEPLTRRIPADGELKSSDTANIGCPNVPYTWNYTITQLTAEGMEVQAGMPIVSFDTKQFQERVMRTRNRLDQARSKLEKARIDELQKLEQLELELVEVRANKVKLDQKLEIPEELQKGLELAKLQLDAELAQEELRLIELRVQSQRDNMKSSIASHESTVRSLERDVSDMEANLAAFTVRAPRPGFVVHAKNWRGEKPKVGENVFIGQAVAEVADLGHMEVRAEIAEADARYVDVGQVAEIRLDAAPDRVFTGKIVELGTLFREKSSEIPKMIFDATLSIDEADPEIMRPGMAAKIDILSPTEEAVIHIPERAIEQTPEGPFVQRQRNGTVERTPVELGARWQGSVVVDSGLQAGDRVSMGGGDAS